MKSKGIFQSFFLLSTLLASKGHCDSIEAPEVSSNKIYLGLFGGVGVSNRVHIGQFGTVFYPADEGGPFAVNALGQGDGLTRGFIGGHIGYQWAPPIPHFPCALFPAFELEGFYLGKDSLNSNDLNNDTPRLPEHHFNVSYPMTTGVFLTNAVLNAQVDRLARLHPYLGAGIGAGLTRIANAVSIQTVPAQPGVYHYNANPNDSDVSFAAQAKLGLRFELGSRASVFLEYRWLYLAHSGYTFGSTLYPDHTPTAPWLVEMDPQHYNAGAVGIQYCL